MGRPRQSIFSQSYPSIPGILPASVCLPKKDRVEVLSMAEGAEIGEEMTQRILAPVSVFVQSKRYEVKKRAKT